jgi:hypothetical protein
MGYGCGQMLKDSVRSCDVCGEVISKEEKYVASTVSKEKVELFRSLNDVNPENAATFTTDSEGNVRLDICLECKGSMGDRSNLAVN